MQVGGMVCGGWYAAGVVCVAGEGKVAVGVVGD